MPSVGWRLACLAVCVLAVATIAAAVARSGEGRTVTSTRWRYSVAVPDGWRGVERDDGSILLATSDATITLVTWLYAIDKPSRASIANALAAQRAGGRPATIAGSMRVLGTNEPVLVVRFATDDGRAFELRQLAVDRGNLQWIVSLTAAVDALDRHVATFRAVVESIAVSQPGNITVVTEVPAR